MRERLPWFLGALPSEDCAKGGAGAYTDALQRSSKEPSGIKARTRAQHPSTHHLKPLSRNVKASALPALSASSVKRGLFPHLSPSYPFLQARKSLP